MTRVHTSATASAPATAASAAANQQSEQRAEDHQPPGLLSPATRPLYSAQSQHHASQCQAEVIPEQVWVPVRFALGLAAVVTTFNTTLVSPSPEAT